MLLTAPTTSSRLLLPLCSRSYSLSRHAARLPGSGRARQRVPRQQLPITQQYEEQPSNDESKLWQTSLQRPHDLRNVGLQTLLNNQSLVVERQIEMLNIFVGFEQCNKYSISNEHGEALGYIVEEPRGMLAILARQAFATHRPFKAVIMDPTGSPLLWIRRPFAWINSRMFIQRVSEDTALQADAEPVLDTFAEVQQIWHPWRRKYDLFVRESPARILTPITGSQPEPEVTRFNQFARVDAGFLSWDFSIMDGYGKEMAFISRAFRGFGRELFTDTGQYAVHFTPRSNLDPSLPSGTSTLDFTLDQRALILSLAVNIDFDYFSRHSSPASGGIFGFSHWE